MKCLPLLATACLLLLMASSNCIASLPQFSGNWTNVDPNTGGITRLNIDVFGSSASVHAWGKCHPTDCDWGSANAFAFGPDVSSDLSSQALALMAVYSTGFSTTTLFIKPQGNRLSAQSYTRFTDNSGRSNYGSSYVFQKSPSILAPGLIAEMQPLQQFARMEVLPLRGSI